MARALCLCAGPPPHTRPKRGDSAPPMQEMRAGRSQNAPPQVQREGQMPTSHRGTGVGPKCLTSRPSLVSATPSGLSLSSYPHGCHIPWRKGTWIVRGSPRGVTRNWHHRFSVSHGRALTPASLPHPALLHGGRGNALFPTLPL